MQDTRRVCRSEGLVCAAGSPSPSSLDACLSKIIGSTARRQRDCERLGPKDPDAPDNELCSDPACQCRPFVAPLWLLMPYPVSGLLSLPLLLSDALPLLSPKAAAAAALLDAAASVLLVLDMAVPPSLGLRDRTVLKDDWAL